MCAEDKHEKTTPRSLSPCLTMPVAVFRYCFTRVRCGADAGRPRAGAMWPSEGRLR